jgi:hypothetical protein
MSSSRNTSARVIVMIILALLVLQYELGMNVNLSDPKAIPPFSLSLNGVSHALNQVGGVAVIHAALGVCLVFFSIISLIFALRSGIRSVQIFGSLAFLTMFLAATTGLLFTLSGFQMDGYTEGMATNFLLSFIFNFMELYFLKPASKILQK